MPLALPNNKRNQPLDRSSAFEIQGTIYPTAAEKVAPFKVLLNGGEQVTYARADGSFVFYNVAPGRYVVDIPSELYLFSQVPLG